MTNQAITQPARCYLGKRPSALITRSFAFVVLCSGSLLALLPVLWMLSTSLKASGDVLLVPPRWIPHPLLWSNYVTALTAQPFALYYRNTISYAFLAVVGETFSSAMVAYALARLRGPGHR